jgi:hypothetical protein
MRFILQCTYPWTSNLTLSQLLSRCISDVLFLLRYLLLHTQPFLLRNFLPHLMLWRHAVAQLIEALQAGRSWVLFPMVSLDCFIDIILSSGRTMPLGSTQPLKEMSNRNASWLCVGLTTLPPSCADCLEIWEPYPPGILRACLGL